MVIIVPESLLNSPSHIPPPSSISQSPKQSHLSIDPIYPVTHGFAYGVSDTLLVASVSPLKVSTTAPMQSQASSST